MTNAFAVMVLVGSAITLHAHHDILKPWKRYEFLGGLALLAVGYLGIVVRVVGE